MKAIYKYPIPTKEKYAIELPKDAQILRVEDPNYSELAKQFTVAGQYKKEIIVNKKVYFFTPFYFFSRNFLTYVEM